MAGRQPEDPVRWPASRHRWCEMTFLHWRYDPRVIRPFLAKGLEVDTWEGAAWVSLTPFALRRFRIGPLPAVEPLSSFPETNLRTYVRTGDGRDGLWFLTLEADSLATVVAASTIYGVPYRWAAMTVETGDTVRYRSRRRAGRPAGHDIAVRPGRARAAPSPLDDWLTGRWRAYTTVAGRLAVASVEHEPWPLHDVEVTHLRQSLTGAVGLPTPAGEPLAHWSPGVRVRLGPPRPVPRGGSCG